MRNLFLIALCVASLAVPLPARAMNPPLALVDDVAFITPADVSGYPLAKAADYTVKTTFSVLSASWSEFPAADIPAFLRDSTHQQILVVTNYDPSAKVCVAYYDRAATTTDCGAGGIVGAITDTCTGSGAADTDPVMPGTQRKFKIRGDQCVYVRSTANASAHLSLVAR